MDIVELTDVSSLEFEGGHFRYETSQSRDKQWGEIVQINFRGKTKWTRRMILTVLVESYTDDKGNQEYYDHAGMRREYKIWLRNAWAKKGLASEGSVDEAIMIYDGTKTMRLLPKKYHRDLLRNLQRVSVKVNNN